MRIKNSNLEWYVLRWDFNKKKIIDYNILHGVAEDLHKYVKKKKVYNRRTLKEYLKSHFMYYYWSKAECEFYISDLHGDDYEKIDMWRQIQPNLDKIVDYVNIRCNLKFE